MSLIGSDKWFLFYGHEVADCWPTQKQSHFRFLPLYREYLIRPKHILLRFKSRRKTWKVRHTSVVAGWSRSPVPFLKPRTDKAQAVCFSQKARVSVASCKLDGILSSVNQWLSVPLAAVAKYFQSAKRQYLMALSAERHDKKTVHPLLGTTYSTSGGIVTLLCKGQTDRLCKQSARKMWLLTDKCRTDTLVSSYWLLPLGSFV